MDLVITMIGIIGLIIMGLGLLIVNSHYEIKKIEAETKKKMAGQPQPFKPSMSYNESLGYVDKLCMIIFKERMDIDTVLSTEVYILDVEKYITDMVMQVVEAIPDSMQSEIYHHYEKKFIQEYIIRTIKTSTFKALEKGIIKHSRKGQRINTISEQVTHR